VTAQQPFTLISIVNWNGFPHTARAIQSILEANWPDIEVVVVDNASRDDSVARLNSEFPDIRVLQAPSNLGFAGGHQLALDYALSLPHSDLFWMLNNDTRVVPQTLPAFLAAYRQFGDAIYGGVPLNDDSTIEALVGVETSPSATQGRDLFTTEGLPFDEVFADRSPRLVTSAHGSNFLVPLNVVRKHGFMDRIFFLYAEETDYCTRLGALGVHSVVVPEAIVFHGDSESTRGKGRLELVVRYYSTRNYLYFVRRHRGWKKYSRVFVRTIRQGSSSLVRSLLKRDQANSLVQLYILSGAIDSLIGRMGKTFAPEALIQDTKS